MKQYAALEDTIYFWFAGNDTSGSGGDGATPAADVRLAGAAVDVAPVLSPTPILLTHVNYPAGCYEVAVAATTGNGFAANNTYAVFCTLAVDGQNPTGFIGSFDLKPVIANAKQLGGTNQTGRDIGASMLLSSGSGAGQLDFTSGVVKSNLAQILGTVLTETAGYIAAGFKKLFNIQTPVLTMESVNQSANNNTILAHANYGNAKLARTGADGDTLETLSDQVDGCNTVVPDAAGVAATPSEVAIALTNIHLDHLLAVDYDPASKPGVATALLNELIENDVGLSRFTQNALEQGPDSTTNLTLHSDYDAAKTAAQAGDNMNLADDAIKATKYDESSAFPVKANDAGVSQIARVGADNDTLETLSNQIDNCNVITPPTVDEIADQVWDEILTGATHNIATSAGRRLREVGAFAIHSGTAQAGTSSGIKLAASADANDGVYNRNLLVLVGGAGIGQTRTIVDYDGTTKVVVVDRDWRVSPNDTTEYQIVPDDTPLTVDHGQVQAATASTVKIREYASGDDNVYLCNIIAIIAGAGRGQARLVGSYDGASKVVTLCGDNWVTVPNTTSIYVMIPYGVSCSSCFDSHALGQIKSECDDALTEYDPSTRTEAIADKDEIIAEVDANETKIDAVKTDTTAIKTKTDNLPSGIAKNVALPSLDVFMVLSSDHVTAATGKTVTGQIRKNGGAFTSITNAITEVGNGWYTIANGLTQAEMNADKIILKFIANDCDQKGIEIFPT